MVLVDDLKSHHIIKSLEIVLELWISKGRKVRNLPVFLLNGGWKLCKSHCAVWRLIKDFQDLFLEFLESLKLVLAKLIAVLGVQNNEGLYVNQQLILKSLADQGNKSSQAL